MPETIKAEELPLRNIFSDQFRFRVPEYQRPYAWAIEQTADLLEDIKHAASTVMSEAGSIKEASPYFLGSIVIIKKGNSSVADVVDGQQRITTLTILFCVLRDIASRDHASQELPETIHKYVREASDVLAGVTGEFRLSVRQRDREFFQSQVQERGNLQNFVTLSPENLPDNQHSRLRMLENTKYLWDQVLKLDNQQRHVLAMFLVQRCYLVVVSTSDHSSAYRIFSVLNDRGLDLSPTDILKAEIIGGMDENVRDRYTDMWENYEDDLGRERYRDLFAHIRMIYVKNKLYRNLQEEFQEHILRNMTHQGFMDDVLTPYHDQYKTITDASYEGASGAETVNTFLSHLNRLDNFDWIPPAMAFFDRNRHDTASLVQFTRDLDRLAYGLFIMRANINERIRRYADLLHAIESSATLSDSTGPLQLTDSEKEQILQALDGPIYRKGSPVPLILLRRLDSALTDKGASYDHSVISVEHVLPQSPDAGSEWIRNFPDQEERERWTHRLANLVLLSRRKNSRAANYDFGRKKDEYFQQNNVTPFALTTPVVNESEWTPEVLRRRQHDLIEVLKKEWRLG